MRRGGEVAVVPGRRAARDTRLGFDGPKGTYPIGPVSAATLFQIHAEKILALGRRYGHHLPLYVMTSPENHEATARFFEEHDRFGLEHLRLFVQGQMPAVDRETGRVLLASKGEVALEPRAATAARSPRSPPGPRTGGTPSCLDGDGASGGSRPCFYFQVDNPAREDRRPRRSSAFTSRQTGPEMSFKVIEKVRAG